MKYIVNNGIEIETEIYLITDTTLVNGIDLRVVSTCFASHACVVLVDVVILFFVPNGDGIDRIDGRCRRKHVLTDVIVITDVRTTSLRSMLVHATVAPILCQVRQHIVPLLEQPLTSNVYLYYAL